MTYGNLRPVTRTTIRRLPDRGNTFWLAHRKEGRALLPREPERRIGVVVVSLDALAGRHAAQEGWVQFRRKAAVVLQGPAIVQLASPFHVERLPPDSAKCAGVWDRPWAAATAGHVRCPSWTLIPDTSAGCRRQASRSPWSASNSR